MPRNRPTTTEISNASPTLKSVQGRCRAIFSSTEVPGERIDIPKSPRTTPSRYSRYCCHNGVPGSKVNNDAA